MAPTRSRPRGREHARPASGGVAAEHAMKIYPISIAGLVAIVAFLALTGVGHVIAAATQHFMLFYAGVFALIALCASVGLGLVATDRMWLHPGRRVLVQSAHRAASFGAVTFLIVHIVTEILAQRVHVLDAVIPFLSPFRTFYIGLGTIASDLIILLVITGIMRGRFNSNGKAWRWRAIHYTSYASFVFGIWHGLLAGRPAKPYVDWSYGFVIAFVVLGLAVRVLSNSLKPKESLSGPPVTPASGSATAPLRAAAMLASMRDGAYRGSSAFSGPQPVLYQPALSEPVFSRPLGAPVFTPLPAAGDDRGEPYYEPGYEGPARYLGAPRDTGTGPMPSSGTGPMPRAGTGPMPRAGTGPRPWAGRVPPSTVSGPLPRVSTGDLPRVPTGPFPELPTGPSAALPPRPPGPGTGPIARAARGEWMARTSTGPQPRMGTGPQPRMDTGPQPRPGTGPMPRVSPPPAPRAGSGSMQAWPGNRARPSSGPMPRAAGPLPPSARPTAPSGWAHRATMGNGQPGSGQPGGGPPRGGQPRGGQPRSGQPGSAQPRYPRDSGRYPGEPAWEDDLPLSDPYLKYRAPGPGMPGYRHGGDDY